MIVVLFLIGAPSCQALLTLSRQVHAKRDTNAASKTIVKFRLWPRQLVLNTGLGAALKSSVHPKYPPPAST